MEAGPEAEDARMELQACRDQLKRGGGWRRGPKAEPSVEESYKVPINFDVFLICLINNYHVMYGDLPPQQE